VNKVIEYAPAKVNLYLGIKGKRPDGYHELVTVFEKISIFDRLIIESLEKDIVKIVTDTGSIPRGPGNICHKAAMLLKSRFNVKKGVRITIKKNIPVAAGLGGGSSDCAAVLKGLNRLWDLRLDEKKLLLLAGELGSDAPFFILNGSFAVGAGRGERLKELKIRKDLWHLVIYPGIKLLTKDIYNLYSKNRSLTLTRGARIAKIHSPKKLIYSMGQAETILHNSLEDVVLRKEPIIKDIKDLLKSLGAKGTLVSGSGSCVFGIFGSRKAADHAKKSILNRHPSSNGWRMFTAGTVRMRKENQVWKSLR